MKVVDEGKMLLNGQVQDHGSSGLNNFDNKAEAEVRERESDAFVRECSALPPSSFFFALIAISNII